jgi:hypothetical protein
MASYVLVSTAFTVLGIIIMLNRNISILQRNDHLEDLLAVSKRILRLFFEPERLSKPHETR